MRLVTFKAGGELRVGVVTDQSAIVDLSDRFATLLDLIEQGDRALAEVQGLLQTRQPEATLAEVELAAPIPVPRRNLFCVGWNYLKHFEEGIGKRGANESELPSHPAFFTKPTTTVNSPYGGIPIDPELSNKFDYEAELAVVIGRAGRSIPEARVADYIFGYMAANDVSVRDMQQRHGSQWLKGKGVDGTCPLGPWIVTADEVPDPQNLSIRCTVNGETRQAGHTGQMIFSVQRIIHELSQGMTLLPGDIILTGTPDGVGAGRTPQQFLHPGDDIVVAIAGIGELRNRMTPQPLAQWDGGA